MTSLDLKGTPHRRFNPLTGAWVLVSPHRTQRPWQGQLERVQKETPPSYDPSCYMCPGNKRAAGMHNPDYQSTFVFDNDYPALLPDTPAAGVDLDGLLVARSDAGICRVLCFSPRHDLTISGMEMADLRRVVDAWAQQWQELGGGAWGANPSSSSSRDRDGTPTRGAVISAAGLSDAVVVFRY